MTFIIHVLILMHLLKNSVPFLNTASNTVIDQLENRYDQRKTHFWGA